MRNVYLDYAATTPLAPSVLEVMRPYFTEHFGNPSSAHAQGRKARVALEGARETMAECLGAEPSEIVFTSGGTEADNLALLGVLHHARRAGRPAGLLTGAAEHKAVLEPAQALQEDGFPVQILSPEEDGAVTPAQVSEALTDETALVSLMHTNNEVGTRTALAEIADLCHAHGALLHTDAVQAAGVVQMDLEVLGVDLASFSAHKFYGPKGAGALYARAGVELDPLVRGGAQERARRGGTENVGAIAGMAEALRRATVAAEERAEHLFTLQHALAERLRAAFGEDVRFNTPLGQGAAAPHILSVSFPPQGGQPLDGEMLLLNLDLEGVHVSAGSACTSGAVEPSHVLLAMGLPREAAAATVRFSFGKDTSQADLDHAAEALEAVVGRMRG